MSCSFEDFVLYNTCRLISKRNQFYLWGFLMNQVDGIGIPKVYELYEAMFLHFFMLFFFYRSPTNTMWKFKVSKFKNTVPKFPKKEVSR